jgi:hypothetical protein
MTNINQSHAPGCFGSALTFKSTAPECISCQFATKCEPISTDRLAKLRAKFGITPPERQKSSRVQNGVQREHARPTFTLSTKATELLNRIEKEGIRVTESLSRRQNPFNSRPAFMKITCHLLLAMEDGLTRDILVAAFERKLNWANNTARTHALLATQVLTALGATHEINGRLKLRG